MSNDLGRNFGCATIAGMRRVALRSRCLASWSLRRRRRRPPTIRSSRARLLYNQGQFEAAVTAAEQARLTPARADAADLVAARALSRALSRQRGAPTISINARERLRRIDPQRFPAARARSSTSSASARRCFSTARSARRPTVFDSVAAEPRRDRAAMRASACSTGGRARSIATRGRGPRSSGRRSTSGSASAWKRSSRRIRRSGTAAYWLAAAARAQGDLQAAWDAAQAGWVRAPLAADRGAALRADLDRLVLRAIVPERARVAAQPPARCAAVGAFKERWNE